MARPRGRGSKAASRADRCSARPTRTGLLMCALISSRMPSACDIPLGPAEAVLTVSTTSRRSRALWPAVPGRGRPPFGGVKSACHRPDRRRRDVAAAQQHQPDGVRHHPGAPGTAALLDSPCPRRLLLPAPDPLRGQGLRDVRVHRFLRELRAGPARPPKTRGKTPAAASGNCPILSGDRLSPCLTRAGNRRSRSRSPGTECPHLRAAVTDDRGSRARPDRRDCAPS